MKNNNKCINKALSYLSQNSSSSAKKYFAEMQHYVFKINL